MLLNYKQYWKYDEHNNMVVFNLSLLQGLTSDNSLVFTLALYQQITVQAKQSTTDKVKFFFVIFVYYVNY